MTNQLEGDIVEVQYAGHSFYMTLNNFAHNILCEKFMNLGEGVMGRHMTLLATSIFVHNDDGITKDREGFEEPPEATYTVTYHQAAEMYGQIFMQEHERLVKSLLEEVTSAEE